MINTVSWTCSWVSFLHYATQATLFSLSADTQKILYILFPSTQANLPKDVPLPFHQHIRLENISTSLGRNGITPQIHGNVKRLPANTLTLKNEYVIYFLLNKTLYFYLATFLGTADLICSFYHPTHQRESFGRLL